MAVNVWHHVLSVGRYQVAWSASRYCHGGHSARLRCV